ncbi:hypothetical protein OsJ_35189 [Oryza sativa Japonica Group]|uniref:Uncharacterized protein n=1 Tax=Oryza sativa subsp. japonica TaxID=39947 RepID=B9GBU6_ORYSJ|nr:hypothetical protein OsJ_35189 [Oryza sativa Japonica Group]
MADGAGGGVLIRAASIDLRSPVIDLVNLSAGLDCSLDRFITSCAEKMRSGRYDLRSNLKRDEKTDFVMTYSKKHRIKEDIVCNEGEIAESLVSGDLPCESNQGVFWSELSGEVASNLSKSVVSLALHDGNTMLFVCSGIAVHRNGHVIKLLTSASLLKAFNDARKDHDNLKVEVHHEDTVVIGFLREYNLDHNMAAVIVENLPDLRPVPFNNVQKFVPHSKVYEGGPLFDFDGDFLGMNLSFTTEGTVFVPGDRVLDQLVNCILDHEVRFAARLEALKEVWVGESPSGEMPSSHQVHRDVLNKDRYGDLESLGYPEPPKSKDGMILAYTFEEPFGDIFGKGVWSELSEDVASSICENTVALASFNGDKRTFACTGFFIEWNECATILTSANLLRDSSDENRIAENLRIEVLLPNNLRTVGTVQHYNLHYNVALVSVKDHCVRQPVKIQPYGHNCRKLLAVGRIFESGRLMAARGQQFPTVVTHDCKFLSYSGCTTTKAGIGGPLLCFDGTFVGMNFYDEGVEGTAFLSWCEIREILKYFKTKGAVAEHSHGNPSDVLDWKIAGDDSVHPDRWPVPMPYWTLPEDLVQRKLAAKIRRQEAILC